MDKQDWKKVSSLKARTQNFAQNYWKSSWTLIQNNFEFPAVVREKRHLYLRWCDALAF